jgi:hypothetical protein
MPVGHILTAAAIQMSTGAQLTVVDGFFVGGAAVAVVRLVLFIVRSGVNARQRRAVGCPPD